MKLTSFNKFIISFLSASILILNSCTTYQKPKNKKLIVCTTGYVADVVKHITGSEAEVITLMGPGVDPHLYKASLKDVDYLSQADLIVYSGLHLEGKMSELLVKLASTRPTLAIADGLEHSDALTLDDKGTHDPHFWFDPMLWKKGAKTFATNYSKLEWGNKDSIAIKSELYSEEMDSLDHYARIKLKNIPADQRYLVTPHDAFAYFCRAYGLKVKSLQGVSTVAEYGIRDVSSLISFLSEKHIPAMFIESSISPKATEAIVAGCRTQGHNISIGGELYSDALGAKGSPEEDYRGVFIHNVNTIYHGLTLNTTTSHDKASR